MKHRFDLARGSAEAILFSRTEAEVRVALLESMPYRGSMFSLTCGDCNHAVHHSPCPGTYCSCPVEHGESADEEKEKEAKHAHRKQKYEKDLIEARAALEAERSLEPE